MLAMARLEVAGGDWSFVGLAGADLGKASLFRIPVVGRIITACGQIPVERGSSHAARQRGPGRAGHRRPAAASRADAPTGRKAAAAR